MEKENERVREAADTRATSKNSLNCYRTTLYRVFLSKQTVLKPPQTGHAVL